MLSLKVFSTVLLINIYQIQCSVLAPAPSHAVAVPAVRYSLVAPQNVRPFAAQVSTFTKGLSVFAAPYAAGVIGGPAIVPAPAPALAPAYPAVAQGALYPEVYAAPAAVAPAPWYPAASPAVVPAPWAPAAPVVAPAPLLPNPFTRSVHAAAPALPPHLHAAPYLG